MRVIGLLLVIVLAIGVACKSTPSGNGNGCKSTASDALIKAQDNLTYDRPSVTISKGQRVCWENGGTTTHTVTALVTVPKDTMVDTLWYSDAQLNSDYIVLASFGAVGDFPYHCRYHLGQGMSGVIHV